MYVRLTALLIFLAMSAIAHAAPFAKGDAAAGKKLFDQHKCNSCHASMLGGDGNAMFTRTERKVKSAASLATQITRCSHSLNLELFPDDEESIGAYLNNHFYKFQ